jgi:CubicO group peptidase (beta-lactamase class C family)
MGGNMTAFVSPEEIGLAPDRLARVYDQLDQAVQRNEIPGAAILVARHGLPLPPRAFGRLRPDPDSPPIQPDTIFLTASVTKPVTVAAVMLLVEQGRLLLDDPVASIIPEFGNRGKEAVTVRQLMTHTSGLPDMLPDNLELRRRLAPLKIFVQRICELDLDFPPGTHLQYQSCGIAMLGEIVERLSGASLPSFLRREIFEPIQMLDTGLGAAGLSAERIAHVNVEPEMVGVEWGWNQSYWWHFGAPWGGMFSTVTDIFRFCQAFLNQDHFEKASIFSPATVQLMTRDQTSGMLAIPAIIRQAQIWDLGWRLQPANGTLFGDLSAPGSFGHFGATGTVVWCDPARDLVCALFTTQPGVLSQSLLQRCSNLVAAAVT